ncbi:MAG: M23 family metallopeptidase [Spirochaetales bacterium]
MTHPVPGSRLTAPFDQMRPLSVPESQRTHVHGAIDLAAPVGTPILATEAGMLYYFVAFRPTRNRELAELELDNEPFDFAGHPYFYDTYGALIVLLGESGKTHLFCHSFMNQLFNDPPVRVRWRYKESPAIERHPLTAFYTTNGYGRYVHEGDHIGDVGSAGYSTGPHVHYEMHSGRRWQPHGDRPNPAEYIEED